MSKRDTDAAWQPDWFTPEAVDTVIVAFPDVYGRLLGKRVTRDHFVKHTAHTGIDTCNYLLIADMNMNTQEGFKLASWEQGYGDFRVQPDLDTLRPVPWYEKTAAVLGHLFREDGSVVEEAPRRVLARQVERLAERGLKAYVGSEPEFHLFDDTYRAAAAKGCSKGECGYGQHEVNLLYADAMETADRHVLYKTGVKAIADQQGRAITFMAKWSASHAGSSCHLHMSLWDAEGKRNLFHEAGGRKQSELFGHFLGGLMRYTRELTYFFAPTVNSYKRYQPGSWAPTRIVWAHDNRTTGYRVVGHGDSMRIENRIPGADANPYLAIAAMLAAGMHGIEEKLDCGEAYRGNAYVDEALPRVPATLSAAAELLADSDLARTAFGADVIGMYVHAARLEAQAFQAAVTDWERQRYFEQI